MVHTLFQEFSESDFKPIFTELDLRKLGASCEVTLENGEKVTLSGKVDRADVWVAPSGELFLRVVDYKTGTREFDPGDIKHGSSLQMPLYLMALTSRAYPLLNKAIGEQAPIPEYIGYGGLVDVERQKIPSDSVLIPAGVTYFSTAVRSENTESMKNEKIAMWDAAKRLSRSGVLLCDSDLLHAASHFGRKSIVGTSKTNRHFFKEEFQDLFAELGNTISRIYGEMKRGVATACPNPEKKASPCGFCKYNAICRVNAAGEKGDQYGA